MFSSVKDHINTPAQTAQSTKAARSRRSTNLVLLAGLVMFWSATMTIFYCQSVIGSVYGLNPDTSSTQMSFFWIMLASSIVGFFIVVLGRKALRRFLLTLSGIVRLALALIMGWLFGGMLFSQSHIQELSQSTLATIEGFKYVSDQIILPSHENADERAQWYDSKGHLWPNKQQLWCSSAQANLNAFIGQNINTNGRTVALSAVLAQSKLTHLHANECLTDEQFVKQNHELTDRAAAGSKSYEIIQRLGYFVPVLQLVGKAEPQLRERALFSPRKACLTLLSGPKDEFVCQTYPSDRRIGVEEFTQMKQTLSSRE